MRLPCLFQFRILKEAVKALISGPYTTKYPFEPHVPAERFRGKPKFHDDDCMGCTACAEVCPADAIDVEDSVESGTRELIYHADICIFCGQCEANCPTEKGIQLSQEYDLACFSRSDCDERVSKTLAICESCGEIIGTREQIIWLAKKLGPLAYSNPTLFLSYLQDTRLVGEMLKPAPRAEVSRADRFNILCPKCRREVVIKDGVS